MTLNRRISRTCKGYSTVHKVSVPRIGAVLVGGRHMTPAARAQPPRHVMSRYCNALRNSLPALASTHENAFRGKLSGRVPTTDSQDWIELVILPPYFSVVYLSPFNIIILFYNHHHHH